jgi:hypothetical protein
MLFMNRSVLFLERIRRLHAALVLLVTLLTIASNHSLAAVAVLTHHNDLNRSGANLNETLLTTNNVNTNQFGRLFTRAVDDEIHTQPLIATNVNVPGKGVFNLVIVATVSNSVYAFDADNASNTAAVWKTNFLSPGIVPPRNTDMTFACGGNYKDFAGNMGIVGTPVIDPVTSTMYLVSRTKEPGPTYVQRLWALDIRTGTEAPNGHVTIAFVNGTAFDGQIQNQRAALALVNGYIYITWSSHCDGGAYHGFVAAYNTTNLALPPLTYNVTPGGSQAGIWMSDQAPPADAAGNIYLTTGNGSFNGTTQFGESFLKLTNTGSALSRVDWFTPFDWNTNLNARDADLGSGGVLLIPGTSLLFSGGKAGRLYLVDGSNMGHIVNAAATSDTNIIQSWDLGSSHQIHGGPVFWDGPTASSFAYIWAASSDRLRQYTFSRVLGKFTSTTPTAQSATIGGSGQPGGLLSLSANGTNSGTAIVWASVNTSSSANQATVAGTLHAYDAQNVAHELWHSDMIPSRDAVGNFAKFVAPTVANGKVYLATFSNRLNVYGLLPPLPLTVFLSGGNLVLTWPTNDGGGFVLQSKTTLDAANWANVGSPVTISNGVYTTVVPASNTATFYRLKR